MAETKLDIFLAMLKQSLEALGVEKSESIIREIESHILTRTEEVGLEEALRAFGSPEAYARRFTQGEKNHL